MAKNTYILPTTGNTLKEIVESWTDRSLTMFLGPFLFERSNSSSGVISMKNRTSKDKRYILLLQRSILDVPLPNYAVVAGLKVAAHEEFIFRFGKEHSDRQDLLHRYGFVLRDNLIGRLLHPTTEHYFSPRLGRGNVGKSFSHIRDKHRLYEIVYKRAQQSTATWTRRGPPSWWDEVPTSYQDVLAKYPLPDEARI